MVTMDKGAKLIAAIGMLIFLVLIPIALLGGHSGWVLDFVVMIGLVLLYSLFYDVLRLNVPVFTLVIFGHVLHALGVFGWYGNSPVPIQWDHVTHVVPMIGFALMFFGWLEQYMDRGFTRKNVMIILAVFFIVTGVGALNELSEFLSFLGRGFGEGAFAFGAGDGFEGIGRGSDVALANNMNVVGGGWINTGWDLTFNAIGAIVGIIIGLLIRAFRKEPKNAYYFEDVSEWSKRIS